jgi:hypothetical protein
MLTKQHKQIIDKFITAEEPTISIEWMLDNNVELCDAFVEGLITSQELDEYVESHPGYQRAKDYWK